jgi:hypothetical protein
MKHLENNIINEVNENDIELYSNSNSIDISPSSSVSNVIEVS